MSWDADTLGLPASAVPPAPQKAASPPNPKFELPPQLEQVKVVENEGAQLATDAELAALTKTALGRLTSTVSRWIRMLVDVAPPAMYLDEARSDGKKLTIIAALATGSPVPAFESDFKTAFDRITFHGTVWAVKHVALLPIDAHKDFTSDFADGKLRLITRAMIRLAPVNTKWQIDEEAIPQDTQD